MLGFIDSIDAYQRNNQLRDVTAGLTSEERTFQRFLFHRLFYAPPSPVIVCEGKTDNAYLKHAIRSLASEFPDLAETPPGGKPRLKVRLYKYTESSTARLVGLKGGGSAVLADFIVNYRKAIVRYKSPGLHHPIIILYDNDSGAGPVLGVIKKKRDDAAPFFHVAANLYAVATPGKDSMIEDYFDAETKAREHLGKVFVDRKIFDEEQHFGKQRFAQNIVSAHASEIDFSGFRPLLSNLAGAIQDYRAKRA
jgi:RNA-directed DNA polymerase